MPNLTTHLRLAVLTAIVFCAATSLAAESSRPHSQVLVEAGWGRPYGELAEDYTETTLGFGAGDGLELGFRWRYHLSNTISISPAFHIMDYRDFKSTDAVIGDYRISSSSLRYTLELMTVELEIVWQNRREPLLHHLRHLNKTSRSALHRCPLLSDHFSNLGQIVIE